MGKRERPAKAVLGQNTESVVKEPVKLNDLYGIKEGLSTIYPENFSKEKTELEEVHPPNVEEPVEESDLEVPMAEPLDEEPEPRTLSSLTYSEMKLFRRTGLMPK